MKAFLLKMSLFCVLLLVVIEMVFRLVLPAAHLPYDKQFQEYGVLALDSSQMESGQQTIGRFCQPSYRWNINNAGFNSAIDFVTPSERSVPCAVVIGNSYAFGLYSDVEEHLAGRLHAGLAGRMEVYNLAVSGMPFSQVPLVSRFAAEKFQPELIIIQTSARSVPGSLRSNGKQVFSQQYSVNDGEVVVHSPRVFTPNKHRHWLRKSALVRYLLYNANYNLGGKGQTQDATQAPVPAGAAALAEAAGSPIVLAIETAMQEISEAAPNARVLVVQDADRAAMYRTGTKPAPLIYSSVLENACEKFGFEFLDLTDTFWQEYQGNRRKLNFEGNYHWNPYGVSVVAESVLNELEKMGVAADETVGARH